MKREREHGKELRKPIISNWKSKIRRSLGYDKSPSTSEDDSIDWTREKIPVIAEEVDRVRQQADKAHQDVLETLEKLASHTETAGLHKVPSDAVSAFSSHMSINSGYSVSVFSDIVLGEPQEQQQQQQRPQPITTPEPTQRPHHHLTSQPAPPQPPSPSPPPPLKALLYFDLELPRRGGFIRHFGHPLCLNLSTPCGLAAAVALLRGYFLHQPRRFLNHFDYLAYHGHGIVVNVNQLFSPRYKYRAAVERVWGANLEWSWVDATEEFFAPALVGLLRDVAEAEAAKSRGSAATLDIAVFVRQLFQRGDEYGLLMDVRRITDRCRGPAAGGARPHDAQ